MNTKPDNIELQKGSNLKNLQLNSDLFPKLKLYLIDDLGKDGEFIRNYSIDAKSHSLQNEKYNNIEGRIISLE